MDELGLELYRYRPLKPDVEDIRLLEILPSTDIRDTVSCRLRHHKLEDVKSTLVDGLLEKKEYETLSYVWGPTYDDGSHLTDMIVCDDQPLLVTANLNQALKRYRETMISRRSCKILWVDAICINQHDVEERSQQVRNMDNVYSCSSHTIIWLGELHLSADIAFFEVFTEWNNYRKVFAAKEGVRDQALMDWFSLREQEKGVMGELLRNPWFTRRWVVQECILSCRQTLLTGSWHISSEDFMAYAKELSVDELGLLDTLFTAYGGSLRSAFRSNAAIYRKSLLWYLHMFDNYRFTNPHDCVYALRAISFDREQIEVDYTKSLVTIFLDLAQLYIKHEETFAPLLAAAVVRRQDGRYPSWLPDWSLPERHRPRLYQEIEILSGVRPFALHATPEIEDRKYLVLRDMIQVEHALAKTTSTVRPTTIGIGTFNPYQDEEDLLLTAGLSICIPHIEWASAHCTPVYGGTVDTGVMWVSQLPGILISRTGRSTVHGQKTHTLEGLAVVKLKCKKKTRTPQLVVLE